MAFHQRQLDAAAALKVQAGLSSRADAIRDLVDHGLVLRALLDETSVLWPAVRSALEEMRLADRSTRPG
jgi:hypothetical protein